MQFGPKRGSVLYIFNNFFKDFGLLIVALIVGLFTGDLSSAIRDNFGVVVIVLVAPITRFVDYFFTKYQVEDGKLTIFKGAIKKHVIEVPISTITTIDVSQNILCQATDRYLLKVDNVSNMGSGNDQSKLKMIFNKADTARLKELLQKKEGVNGLNLVEISDERKMEDTSKSLKISPKKILFMGLLQSKGVLFMQGLGIIFFIIGYTREGVLNQVTAEIQALSVLLLMGLIAGLFLLAMMLGGISSVIRYAGFTISDKGKDIHIRYGLITKKSFTLDKERISGFSYEQSMLMRRLKVGTVKAFAIGFGQDAEDSNETAVIHPLLAEEDLMDFIGGFMQEFDGPCPLTKATPKAFRYFFLRFSFFFAILCLGASVVSSFLFISWLWIVGILIFLLAVFGRILEYHHSAAGGNEKYIELVTGGLSTTKIFVKRSNVEAVSDVGSAMKRRKGLCNIDVDFLGPVATTSRRVYNLDLECSEKLKKLMIY